MPAGPVQTLRLAAGAARRAFVADLAFAAGRGLSFGAAGGLLLIGASKLGVHLPPWPVLVGASAGIGLAAAAAWAIARRWSPMRAAEVLDERLGLQDRLATAIAVSDASDPFAQWAIADAEHAAPSVKIDRAIPVRLDWTWSAWPLLAAGATAVAIFAPVRSIIRNSSRPEPTEAERTQAAAQLRQTADAIRQSLPDEKVQAATAEQLKALEELQNELSHGRVDPEQAAIQAAKQVEDVAKRLEADSAAAQKAADAMREQLAKAATETSGRPESERPSPLMDAIQRGDIRTAAEAAAAAAENEQNLTPQEREQLARDLDQLAQALEAAKEPPAPAQGQPPAAPTGADNRPRGDDNTGTPPKEEEVKPSEPKSRQSPAPNPPSNQSHADRPDADKPAEPSPASSANEREQRETLSKDLREAAEELRKPPKPPEQSPGEGKKDGEGQVQPQPTEQNSQKRPAQDRPKSDKPDGQEGHQPPAADQKNGQQKNDQSSKQNSKEGSPAEGNKQQGQPGTHQAESKPSKAPSDKQPQSQKDGQRPEGSNEQVQPGASQSEPKPGQSAPERPSQGQQGVTGATQGQNAPKPESKPGHEDPTGRPQKQPDGSQPDGAQPQVGQQGSSGPTGAQQKPDGKQPDEKQPSGQLPQGQPRPNPQESPSPTGDPKGNAPETGEKTPDDSGLKKVARDLKRVQDGSGQLGQKRLKQYHELGRKMLEPSSPEQREQVRRMAEDLARQSSEAGDDGPGSEPAPMVQGKPRTPFNTQTTPIDARRPATVSGNEKPPERTISEWYSDKPIDRNQPPGGLAPADAMRQAADGAERAIENQQVPGRYQDLVRRVFRRYSEQAPPK